jgi:hypothetical protein
MSEGISLGWHCASAGYGISHGIRRRKVDGYLTCPFDEMISNYPGLIECIKSDFEDFTNLGYLELKPVDNGEFFIYNTKYKFLFNHESPGHANLYITQNWAGGINHYIENNYEKFIERYQRRIKNFRDYLASGKHIKFIMARYDADDNRLLNDAIKERYPNLSYEIIVINSDTKQFIYSNMKKMGFDDEDDEIKRLHM